MPSDDYTTVARGPLKLKGVAGGKVKKSKKKNKDKKLDLEKNLSTGDDSNKSPPVIKNEDDENKQSQLREGSEGTDIEKKERRTSQSQEPEEEENEETKTEAERRFLEAKRKRLKEMTESGRVRPELLKTHKQRVEELNAHLSRLSEHHDMPKIGPG